MYLAGLFERALVIAVHISLSLIVWLAVNVDGRKWLFPLAILLHATLNIPAGMFQAGILKSIFWLEILLLFGAAAISVLAVFLYRKYYLAKTTT